MAEQVKPNIMAGFSKTYKFLFVALLFFGAALYLLRKPLVMIIHPPAIGTAIDSFNGVKVYYNGAISNVQGRNTAPDGYNLGLKFQCVEFVKRYYYEYYHHKMPDSYGHAVSFYDESLKDGSLNKRRDLMQYSNPGKSKPRTGDLLVYSGNPYGHVAIVCEVADNEVTIIQQNPGIGVSSRASFQLSQYENLYKIHQKRILGWLRIK